MRVPTRLIHGQTGEVYYRVRYRRDGKQKALTFYGDEAKRDAQEFASLLDTLGADRAVAYWNASIAQAEAVGMSLDEWFPRYLAATTDLTKGTRLTYERTYARVWSEPLGQKPIDAISREDIAHVINRLSATKADKTVRNAYGVLASAFKIAVRDSHLTVTPCMDIRMPRRTEHTETEMRFLTYEEWDVLRECLPAHYVPLFATLVGTGMRWGEAEALTVSDIVLEPTPIVRIIKAAKWDPSQATRQIGPTKTKQSNRTVTLPPPVIEVVAPLLDRPGAQRLFLAPKGGQLRHRTVYDDWKKSVQASGLEPHPRIHDLRHTHVAWLIAQGIPLPVIQARLGHKDISTTINRYGHLMPDLQIAAAQAAAVAMSPRRQLV